MTPEQLKIFEEKLTEAVDKFIAGGGEVCFGSFYEGDKQCPVNCLINTVVLDRNGDPGYAGFLSQAMGFEVTAKEMWEFINGFDDQHVFDSSPELYKFGASLRQKYIEKP